MSLAAWRRYIVASFLVGSAAPLTGCGSLLTQGSADAAGVASAGIAGAVSKDATVGAAIGLGVASLAGTGVQYAERRVHRTEQDSIAQAAGALAEGTVGDWRVVHSVPIEENEHGQLIVTRSFGGANFMCREIVFSVDTGSATEPDPAFYTATVCRDRDRWKWATAEPATERWGALQ